MKNSNVFEYNNSSTRMMRVALKRMTGRDHSPRRVWIHLILCSTYREGFVSSRKTKLFPQRAYNCLELSNVDMLCQIYGCYHCRFLTLFLTLRFIHLSRTSFFFSTICIALKQQLVNSSISLYPSQQPAG